MFLRPLGVLFGLLGALLGASWSLVARSWGEIGVALGDYWDTSTFDNLLALFLGQKG